MSKPKTMIRMPNGYKLGQRVRTTKRYAACFTRSPGPHYGTIVGGSRGHDGRVCIKLDHQKFAKPLLSVWFEVVG